MKDSGILPEQCYAGFISYFFVCFVSYVIFYSVIHHRAFHSLYKNLQKKPHVSVDCLPFAINRSSKDSTNLMSETCKIRTRQVKFRDCKANWACKIVESKLTK